MKPTRLRKTEARGPVQSVTWRELCEPHFADHYCRAVEVSLSNLVHHSYPTLLYEVLRRDLVAPAEAYLGEFWPATGAAGRTDLQACRALVDCAETLADRLEAGHPFSEPDIADYPARLRQVWGAFIEHAAGPPVAYAVVQRSRKASGPRVGKQPERLARGAATIEALVQWMAVGGLTVMTDGDKLDAAAYFGVSQRTIARRYAEALEARRLP